MMVAEVNAVCYHGSHNNWSNEMSLNVTKNKLKFYLEKNYNVLLVGPHGTGKTSLVKEVFDEANINWAYFSASTMDPWVDFIGVPKEKTDANGLSYLDLVRPRRFAADEVEAIILDEFNRSHKKVRNAVMELIQFKSINGQEFKNLRVVWAAINPDDDDETYSVEKLDPAQWDRFQVKLHFDNKPDKAYFKNKFGEEWAGIAISWFNTAVDSLKNSKTIKDHERISPRTLDYALQVLKDGGDIRDVIPACYNIQALQRELTEGSTTAKLQALFEEGDKEKTKAYINKANVIDQAIKLVSANNKGYKDYFLPLVSSEYLVKFVSENDNLLEYIISPDIIETYHPLLLSLSALKGLPVGKQNKISKALNTLKVKTRDSSTGVVKFFGNTNTNNASMVSYIASCITDRGFKQNMDLNTVYRVAAYNNIVNFYSDTYSNDETEIYTLKILLKMVDASQAGTLAKAEFVDLIPLINSQMKKLAANNVKDNEIVKVIKNAKTCTINRIPRVQSFFDMNSGSLYKQLPIL